MWRLYLIIAVLIALAAWFIVRQARRNGKPTSAGARVVPKSVPSSEGRWDSYPCAMGDRSASVLVNLDAKEFAPDAGRPWLVSVHVKFQAPREDGLSSDEESSTLFAIDDRLTQSLVRSVQAIHVGNVTTAGRREFYYYAATTRHTSSVVADVFKQFPSYEYDLDSWEDATWDAYLGTLYPNDLGWQWIKDAQVVQVLEENGDDPSIPRIIEHWAYFGTKSDQERFATRVTEQGFGSIEKNDDANGERPFGVHFSRTDAADLHSVYGVSCKLLRLAQECNGEYDGWETQVTSSDR